jgi:hypothetical protein
MHGYIADKMDNEEVRTVGQHADSLDVVMVSTIRST